MYFLVFTGRKWENVMGKKGITWEIAGVFDAPDEHNACLVACQRTGAGTAFALDGYAWGVDTVQAEDVSELGAELSPMERIERMGRRLEKGIESALERSNTRQLDRGDDDE